MRILKNLMLMFAALLSSTQSMAQEVAEVEMADGMMASGKIYVVVGVLTVIFLGIVVYLILLDRKIGKLEKEINNQ